MKVDNQTTLVMNGREKGMLRSIIGHTTKEQMDEIAKDTSVDSLTGDELLKFVHDMLSALEEV